MASSSTTHSLNSLREATDVVVYWLDGMADKAEKAWCVKVCSILLFVAGASWV